MNSDDHSDCAYQDRYGASQGPPVYGTHCRKCEKTGTRIRNNTENNRDSAVSDMPLLGNLVFFVFGRFIIFLGYVLGGILLCLTITVYPLAKQHMKLVPIALMPFGHVMRDIKD